MKKKLILTIITAMFACLAFANMSFDIDVSYPSIRNSRFDTDLPVTIEPGEPMIAFYPIRILLPGGHRFLSADIELGIERMIDNVYLDYARSPQPISLKQYDQTEANKAIYNSDTFFPEVRYEILGVERKNGHDILILNVYPYLYNPALGQLKWIDSFRLTVETEYEQEIAAEQNLFLVQSERVYREIENLVMNPSLVHTYQKHQTRTDSILPSLDNPYRMVIISSAAKETIFTDYISWKESRNISAGFFTIEDIYQSYTGNDNQDKIRNFIIDAYQTYSQTDTPLEYVILGGDDRIIPIRGMYGHVGNYVDYYMPADIYYSNLDGCWDANGNGIYGEPADNIDWFAEVALGRIPAFTDQQFLNFFQKSQHYVENNTYSNDIVYMMGENLDGIPTWGGDYKDEIIPYIPTDYHINTLYERDGTFSISNVVNSINSGLGIINHIGHANYFIVFGLNNSRINNLHNTQYGFAYTQGCLPAAFDTATSQDSGCVGQNLVTASGGLFAFIGNTRYGWYMPGSTNGPSQAFDITFFSALYDHDVRELGHAMNLSKETLVNQAMSSGVMRWVYYVLVLFGDPSIEVKDANGTFPYLEPVDVVYDDITGDNDGIVNPGETIHVYLEIENLEGWAHAYDATASISFDSDMIYIHNGTTHFGDIAGNSTANNSSNPLIIEFDLNIPYGTYKMLTEVSAYGSANAEFSKTYELEIPVTLIQNNWPWSSQFPISASPVFTDFTNDGLEELVVLNSLGSLFLLNSDAETVQEPLLNNESIWRSFSLGDFSNNGSKEIAIASRYGRILAFDPTGDTVFGYEDCGQNILTPVLADLNSDGNKQLISFGLNRNLYVFDSDGYFSEGFPVLLPQTSIGDIAVADINGNGFREIIIGAIDGNIYVVDHNGSILPDFPVSLGAGIVTAPTILDNKKIAVGTTNNKLFLVSPEGELLVNLSLPQRISTEVIAADFTNNGELEIAFVTNGGTAFIVNQNGDTLEGWPISHNEPFRQPPLAVDLNGDNNVNLILVSTLGNVHAYCPNGLPVDSFPYPLGISVTSPAAIADIDGDGDWDIIIATSNGITVVDCKHPMGHKSDWTVYRGNIQRTGYYGDNITTDVDIPFSEYVTELRQNYPNPFNPATRIDFSIKQDSPVKLEVFNIRGQRVRTIINEDLPAGNHSVIWDGTNSSNRIVGAGIYFYRLTTSDTTDIRKMLLLK